LAHTRRSSQVPLCAQCGLQFQQRCAQKCVPRAQPQSVHLAWQSM
jgi:hypothetical protein